MRSDIVPDMDHVGADSAYKLHADLDVVFNARIAGEVAHPRADSFDLAKQPLKEINVVNAMLDEHASAGQLHFASPVSEVGDAFDGGRLGRRAK